MTGLYKTTLGTNTIDVTVSDGVPAAPPWLVTVTNSNKVAIQFTETDPHVTTAPHHSAVGQFTVGVNEQDVPSSTSFATFCVDLNRDIFLNDVNLPYDVMPLDQALMTTAGTTAADAGKVAYLYNHFGLASLSPTDSVGLQLAIWTLEYDHGTLTVNSVDNPPPTVADVTNSMNHYLTLAAGKSERAYFLNPLPPWRAVPMAPRA